jgi:cytochrome oxidase complex assembly protein 1
MNRVEDHQQAVAVFGKPIRHGLFVSGFLQNGDDGFGAARFELPVKGSKQNATLHATLGRVEGNWVFFELKLILANHGTALNLLESADDRHRAALETERHVYLVPLGELKAEELGLDRLPDYYQKKFNLRVTLLSPLPLEDRVKDKEREQLIADALLEHLPRQLPQLAKDGNAVMIGIASDDMYFRQGRWPFAYTFWDNLRVGLVSSHRFETSAESGADLLFNIRVRKMVSRVIGKLVYRMPFSEDPTSVMAKEL